MIEYYTDGSAKSNGRKNSCGGFGIARINNGVLDLVYQENDIDGATNNQMELEAIAWALNNMCEELMNGSSEKEFTVYTDSEYSLMSLTVWYKSWAKNNWIKSNGQPVKNKQKIKLITSVLDGCKENRKDLTVKLEKVPGHSGVEYNELADKLATGEIKGKELMNGKKE